MDIIAYHLRDQVMPNRKNYKTGQPAYTLELWWEGPFAVLKASSYTVTVQLLVNMKIFNTFHISIVRPYHDNSVAGQSKTNDNIMANRGQEVVRTDDGVETEEWCCEKMMNCGKANNGR
jgi:hypothetical protein